MYHGILNVYKEAGFTSHDVVAKLRGILKQKKIGHTGTLDPDAVGVLPVCLGNGTKLCGFLTDKTKEYVARMQLGVRTDTQDMSGRVLETRAADVTREEVERVCGSFLGGYAQIPPMYSALKVDGKRLYALARAGKEVEVKPRKVQILELEVLDTDWPYVTMRVVCGKGTYIRTLCQDIGERLGCLAAMRDLTRTRSGNFRIEEAYTLSRIEQMRGAGELEARIVPVDAVFEQLPAVRVAPQWRRLVENGNSFRTGQCAPAGGEDSWDGDAADGGREAVRQVRVYRDDGLFMGVYRREGDAYRPVKMFISGLEHGDADYCESDKI